MGLLGRCSRVDLLHRSPGSDQASESSEVRHVNIARFIGSAVGARGPMKPITAVVFDMDGVLVDSEPLHLRATQATLGARGASYSERDNRAFFGATDVELLRVLRILFDLPEPTAALVDVKTEHLIALIRGEARPLPGVPEVPLGLRARGLSLALVTASRRPIIEAVLETIGLDGGFDAIVSGEEVARGKPAPDGFLMAARRLGVEPARCLVVEDSRNGVLAGKAAGMLVAAVPCPATSHEDFSAADLVLPSLEALPKALEGLEPTVPCLPTLRPGPTR
jgi:HAD superfamily hydrolase (TIGR01509 family)